MSEKRRVNFIVMLLDFVESVFDQGATIPLTIVILWISTLGVATGEEAQSGDYFQPTVVRDWQPKHEYRPPRDCREPLHVR